MSWRGAFLVFASLVLRNRLSCGPIRYNPRRICRLAKSCSIRPGLVATRRTGVVNFTGCTTRPATTTSFLRWTLLVPMELCCLLFTVPRRTDESFARDAAAMEEARVTGRSQGLQNRLSKLSGIKEHSLFFASSGAMRLAYPHLTRTWSLGPSRAPYDVMHLPLQNVAPLLWKLFASTVSVEGTADEDYLLPAATVALIGREMVGARRTMPRAQARLLRNIDTQFR